MLDKNQVFPQASHWAIRDFFETARYRVQGEEGAWFVEYQTYDYKPKGAYTAQQLTIFRLPNGKFKARVTGAAKQSLSNRPFECDTAVQAAFDAVYSRMAWCSETPDDKLVRVGN